MKQITQLSRRLQSINPLQKKDESFKIALDEAVEALKKQKQVIAIVLFGSFARGDYSILHSDIDLFVFIGRNEREEKIEENLNLLAAKIGGKHKVTLHLTFQYNQVTEEDSSLIKRLAKEGKVLYNKNILIISKEILGLKPFELIKFDTSGVKQINKTKFSRLLHGSKSWYYKDGKKVVKQYESLIDNNEVFDAGKGALLIIASKADKLAALAEELGIKVKSQGSFYR